MSHQAIEAVLNHSQSNSTGRVLLLAIAHYTNEKSGWCKITLSELVKKTGVGRREIQKSARKLEEAGELRVVLGGAQRANSYKILLGELGKNALTKQLKEAKQSKSRWTTRYYEWRGVVKYRDNYSCKQCGDKNNLHVHHILPYALFPDSVFEVDNGITLCEECHNKLKGSELDHVSDLLELIQ